MINVAPIRAAASATAGDIVGLNKAQLAQLLDEVERGQRAERQLRILEAVTGPSTGGGIAGVSSHN